MTPLDVNFGIFILLPPGWIIMAVIILCECYIFSKILCGKKFDKRMYLTQLISNSSSGILGIVISLLLTQGGIIVLWFPWLTARGLSDIDVKALLFFTVFYILTFILSVGVEWVINILLLKKKYRREQIWRATISANVATYIFGVIVLLIVSLLDDVL